MYQQQGSINLRRSFSEFFFSYSQLQPATGQLQFFVACSQLKREIPKIPVVVAGEPIFVFLVV
jgi:hypothetical protein